MKFDFEFLERMEREQESVGRWKGIIVMSASKDNLWKLGGGVLYVVYDDGNHLVGRTKDSKEFLTYGVVSVNGEVKEWPNPKPYSVRRKYTYTEKTPTRQEYKAEIIADVRIENEIDRVLRSAWELDIATMVGEL